MMELYYWITHGNSVTGTLSPSVTLSGQIPPDNTTLWVYSLMREEKKIHHEENQPHAWNLDASSKTMRTDGINEGSATESREPAGRHPHGQTGTLHQQAEAVLNPGVCPVAALSSHQRNELYKRGTTSSLGEETPRFLSASSRQAVLRPHSHVPQEMTVGWKINSDCRPLTIFFPGIYPNNNITQELWRLNMTLKPQVTKGRKR